MNYEREHPMRCQICDDEVVIRFPSPLNKDVKVCEPCRDAIAEAAPIARGYAAHRERRAGR